MLSEQRYKKVEYLKERRRRKKKENKKKLGKRKKTHKSDWVSWEKISTWLMKFGVRGEGWGLQYVCTVHSSIGIPAAIMSLLIEEKTECRLYGKMPVTVNNLSSPKRFCPAAPHPSTPPPNTVWMGDGYFGSILWRRHLPFSL
jgi:hypothetical protein